MSTPTAAQIDALLNFLEEHLDLAPGNLTSIEGRRLSHRLWEEICTTLNAMDGCTKTIKQWQKVWTNKKKLAKRAAYSVMEDGFQGPQTSARVPAFVDHATPETSTAASTQSSQEGDLSQLNDNLLVEPQDIELNTHVLPSTSQQTSATTASAISIARNKITSTRQRRERKRKASRQADSFVQDRLFRLEERRLKCEEQCIVELAGIRMAVEELGRHMQHITQLIVAAPAKFHL